MAYLYALIEKKVAPVAFPHCRVSLREKCWTHGCVACASTTVNHPSCILAQQDQTARTATLDLLFQTSKKPRKNLGRGRPITTRNVVGGKFWTGSIRVHHVNTPAQTSDLAEIVSKLEYCLEASEALGLSLLTALVDHALGEAKKHLDS
jgi:hypothetical protein